MSKASQIINYMQAEAKHAKDDYVPLDLNEMAKQLNSTRERLVSNMSSMVHSGRFDWAKDDEGKIIGYRNLIVGDRRKRAVRLSLAKTNGNPQPAPQPIVRKVVQTPELDRVFQARSAMHEFVDQFPGLVDRARLEQSMQYDPDKLDAYVGEGISLIERNRWLEKRNAELSSQLNEAVRERDYLRTKNDSRLQEGLASAGVTHAEV